MDLPVLRCGNCEPLKLGVHAGALGLAALCGIYNAAAWLSRRESHLAVNTLLYTMLTIWEQQHVAHHLATMRKLADAGDGAVPVAPPETAAPAPPGPDASIAAAA